MNKKIVMLVRLTDATTYMYNGINEEFNISNIIVEEPVHRLRKLAKRRVKKLGYFKVIGQILFLLICTPILRLTSTRRLNEIKTIYNLNDKPIEKEKMIPVTSINSEYCLKTLKKIKPDLIIVKGTGIISKKILENFDVPFVNMHAGITPKYRGIHGGYWSLVNNDLNNCGVTVHLVDAGIDTGGILYQALINPTNKDNFTTYPYIQIGEGIKLMKRAISSYLNGDLKTQESKTKESTLWYHPTIWYYLSNRIFKGIK